MNKLGENFVLNKYGLNVRLVNEGDAEFILSLRTDNMLGRFIHSTDNDVEKQKEWIREYKNREKDGREFYFIYYNENQPIGVNRIYDIYDTYATGGSWVCKQNIPFELPVLILIIMREIIFEKLNLRYDRYDIRKKNLKVLRINDLFCPKKTGETELDYFFELSKDIFERRKEYLLDLLNIKR